MKKTLTILMLLLSASGCEKQAESEPGDTLWIGDDTTTIELQQAKDQPRLWIDEKTAEMIQATSDYDAVYVVRWEKSKLHGWVELTPTNKDTPLTYDLSVPRGVDAVDSSKNVSGWMIVAMRKSSDTPESPYEVRIERQYTLKKKRGSDTYRFKSRRGLHEISANTSGNISSFGPDHFELQIGQERNWLKVSLNAADSMPQGNVERDGAAALLRASFGDE